MPSSCPRKLTSLTCCRSTLRLRFLHRPLLSLTVEAEAAATAEDVRAAQGIAGELTWLACRARPDVSFATNKLSQLISRSPSAAIRIGYSVLQCLKGTVSLGLVYGPACGDHGPDGVFRVKGGLKCTVMRGWGATPDDPRRVLLPCLVMGRLLGCRCVRALQRFLAQKLSSTALCAG